MRRLLILLALAAGGIAIAFWTGAVPNRWNPWAPILVDDPPNVLTRFKLKALADNPAACHALLAAAGVGFTPAPDRIMGEGCGFHNAVRIERFPVSLGGALTASCPLAGGLALFERHALQPAARAAFARDATSIEHFGTYACRNVDNREPGRRSQHGTANAFDAAGFRMAGGKTVTVAKDWSDAGADGAFLRDVHDRACRLFGAVLGPNYNAAHRDHFHFDMGGFAMCR
jgi:hypothetical protein